MTGAINNLAASAAGAPLTSAQGVKAKREEETREAKRRRGIRDEFHSEVDQTESAEAVRGAEDSTQEQTREDHEEHATGYSARGRPKGDDHPRLDLSA
ncbi:MAG: hypothetical protein R3B49_08545 [Phycisphaerales bacterium]